jgi:hypothetical protein
MEQYHDLARVAVVLCTVVILLWWRRETARDPKNEEDTRSIEWVVDHFVLAAFLFFLFAGMITAVVAFVLSPFWVFLESLYGWLFQGEPLLKSIDSCIGKKIHLLRVASKFSSGSKAPLSGKPNPRPESGVEQLKSPETSAYQP